MSMEKKYVGHHLKVTLKENPSLSGTIKNHLSKIQRKVDPIKKKLIVIFTIDL
jgi:hypothetical protein